MVQQRHGLERSAEQQHLALGCNEASKRAVFAERILLWVSVREPLRARSNRGHTGLRMEAAASTRPGANALRDATVIAIGLSRREVEHRRLGQIGLPMLRRPLLQVVGVLLPGGERHQRATRPEGL